MAKKKFTVSAETRAHIANQLIQFSRLCGNAALMNEFGKMTTRYDRIEQILTELKFGVKFIENSKDKGKKKGTKYMQAIDQAVAVNNSHVS